MLWNSWLPCFLLYSLLTLCSVRYILLTPALCRLLTCDIVCILCVTWPCSLHSVWYTHLTHTHCLLHNPDSYTLYFTYSQALHSVLHSVLYLILGSVFCAIHTPDPGALSHTYSWPLHFVHYTCMSSALTPPLYVLRIPDLCTLIITHS